MRGLVLLGVVLKSLLIISYFPSPPERTEIDITIGILRLAHKYDVSFLRRRALGHLGTMYFTRLEDYDTIQNRSPYEISTILKTTQVAVEVGAL